MVLAAAGSADPRAIADTRSQAAMLASHLQVPVLAAFASAARPSLDEAVTALAARTGGPVAVASYLLAPGVFADRLRASGAAWVSAPLGDHPAVAALVVERFRSRQAPREAAAAGHRQGPAASGLTGRPRRNIALWAGPRKRRARRPRPSTGPSRASGSWWPLPPWTRMARLPHWAMGARPTGGSSSAR